MHIKKSQFKRMSFITVTATGILLAGFAMFRACLVFPKFGDRMVTLADAAFFIFVAVGVVVLILDIFIDDDGLDARDHDDAADGKDGP